MSLPAVLRAGAMVLGADTVVVCDGEVLGKPPDAAEATRMLLLLSGRTHHVVTGVAVVWGKGATEVAAELTHVTMRTLSPQEVADYVATGEPMDKAGAYAIQGYAAGGFRESTAATSTWSGCRSPWSRACWKERSSD